MKPIRTLLLGAVLVAAPLPGPAQDRTRDGTFTMALTGDAIITRKLSVYGEPEFVRMLELIRGADAAFTNLEMLFHDFEPYPMHQSGGTYMRAEPALAKELVWAGFDLVSMANNHSGDYGVDGMRLTRRHAEAAGLVGAGTGENLAEAREPRFLETARGRVALVSAASTFPEHSAAGRPRGAVRGRPGMSPLRHTRLRVVTRDQMERMRALLTDMGLTVPRTGDTLRAFNEQLVVGERPAVRTIPNPDDVREIAAAVRNASRLAEHVIVSVHAHERGAKSAEPAEFLVTFARAMVDAGADVFVGHGPHELRGIEIYKGKLILYSLGDFMFQNETVLRLPDENYRQYGLDEDQGVGDFNDTRYPNDARGFPSRREVWESVVAVARWRGEDLQTVELHPITLGFGKPRPVRGRPMLADRELGRKIIGDLIERSQPFGTVIEWRDGTGVVRVGGDRPRAGLY